VNGDRSKRLIVAGFKSSTSAHPHGLLAVDPEDGREVWRRPLAAPPDRHRCSWPRGGENKRGPRRPDCVVVGKRGLLAALDAERG